MAENVTKRDYERYRTHHASRRLRGYDYAAPAAYFVTICTDERRCLFGAVREARMQLNAYGRIVEEEWRRSETVRAEIALDAFVVMPNHVHGIVVIAPPDADAPTDPHGYCLEDGANPDVATQRAASLPVDAGGRVNVAPKSLGAFVRAFKSAVTRRIRRYIERNPERWDEDKNHPTRL